MKRSALLALLFFVGCGGPTAEEPSSVAKSAPAEPDEPCTVEAPPGGEAAARRWCEGGLFSHVAVNQDETAFVAMLQFSKKGLAGYKSNGRVFLDHIRRTTDDMAAQSGLGVAISLHDSGGQLIGGCTRQAGASAAVCK